MTRRRVEFSRAAAADVAGLQDYYAEFGAATASRVLADLRAIVEHIAWHPHAGAPGVLRGTRHAYLTKYPYTVIYRFRKEVVSVVRVLHQRRRFFNR